MHALRYVMFMALALTWACGADRHIAIEDSDADPHKPDADADADTDTDGDGDGDGDVDTDGDVDGDDDEDSGSSDSDEPPDGGDVDENNDTDGDVDDVLPCGPTCDDEHWCYELLSECFEYGWTQLEPGTAPSPRSSAGFACGPEACVLFGGRVLTADPGEVVAGDTWLWDGTEWFLLEVDGGPAPRHGRPLTYHDARGTYILFGGFTGAEPMGDTWEFDGDEWSRVDYEGEPTPRAGHAMAYDREREVILLFGGRGTDSELLGDTWAMNNEGWREITGDGPRAASAVSMAFDDVLGAIVLPRGGETWEWNGRSWRMSEGSTRPPAYYNTMTTFDRRAGAIVLFGGKIDPETWSDQTWERRGPTWSLIETDGEPSPRSAPAMAYDPRIEAIILFGGVANREFIGDTWVYRPRP